MNRFLPQTSMCLFQSDRVSRVMVYSSFFSFVFVSWFYDIFVSFSVWLFCYEESSVIGRARRPRWLLGRGSRGWLEFLERVDGKEVLVWIW